LSLPSRGQEFCTELHARALARGAARSVPPSEPRAARLPRRHSLLRVEPARDVLLSAVKPTGNPIATGSAADTDPSRGITLRLAESTGLGRRATVDSAFGLADVWRANLLERPHEPTDLALDLTGFEVATVVATPVDAAAAPADPRGQSVERSQPGYARYWLHNRGTAPMGYLPITVAVSPRSVHWAGDGPLEIEVVLASQLRDAAHESVVHMRVPAGWSVDPADQAYELPAGGHLRFAATVTPAADAAEGTYFVAAQIDHAGVPVEDVTTVVVGEREHRRDSVVPIPEPRSESAPAATPVATAATASTAGARAHDAAPTGETSPLPEKGAASSDGHGPAAPPVTGRETGLVVDVTDREVVVSPGARATIAVTLTNLTRDEVRGEAQLVSPWGTWDVIPQSLTAFGLPARARTIVDFPVVVPPDAEPGHAWAMVKVMWFGRCQYAPTIRLVIA
jgi:hypothetical protein